MTERRCPYCGYVCRNETELKWHINCNCSVRGVKPRGKH